MGTWGSIVIRTHRATFGGMVSMDGHPGGFGIQFIYDILKIGIETVRNWNDNQIIDYMCGFVMCSKEKLIISPDYQEVINIISDEYYNVADFVTNTFQMYIYTESGSSGSAILSFPFFSQISEEMFENSPKIASFLAESILYDTSDLFVDFAIAQQSYNFPNEKIYSELEYIFDILEPTINKYRHLKIQFNADLYHSEPISNRYTETSSRELKDSKIYEESTAGIIFFGRKAFYVPVNGDEINFGIPFCNYLVNQNWKDALNQVEIDFKKLIRGFNPSVENGQIIEIDPPPPLSVSLRESMGKESKFIKYWYYISSSGFEFPSLAYNWDQYNPELIRLVLKNLHNISEFLNHSVKPVDLTNILYNSKYCPFLFDVEYENLNLDEIFNLYPDLLNKYLKKVKILSFPILKDLQSSHQLEGDSTDIDLIDVEATGNLNNFSLEQFVITINSAPLMYFNTAFLGKNVVSKPLRVTKKWISRYFDLYLKECNHFWLAALKQLKLIKKELENIDLENKMVLFHGHAWDASVNGLNLHFSAEEDVGASIRRSLIALEQFLEVEPKIKFTIIHSLITLKYHSNKISRLHFIEEKEFHPVTLNLLEFFVEQFASGSEIYNKYSPVSFLNNPHMYIEFLKGLILNYSLLGVKKYISLAKFGIIAKKNLAEEIGQAWKLLLADDYIEEVLQPAVEHPKLNDALNQKLLSFFMSRQAYGYSIFDYIEIRMSFNHNNIDCGLLNVCIRPMSDEINFYYQYLRKRVINEFLVYISNIIEDVKLYRKERLKIWETMERQQTRGKDSIIEKYYPIEPYHRLHSDTIFHLKANIRTNKSNRLRDFYFPQIPRVFP